MFNTFWKWVRTTDLYFSLYSKRTPSFRIEGSCQKTGKCCQNLILIDRGKPVRTLKTFSTLVKREPYHKMFVPREELDSAGRLRFTCTNLTDDHRCSIYDKRPSMCKTYPEPTMIKMGGKLLSGCGFRLVYEKNFEKFVDENLRKNDKL